MFAHLIGLVAEWLGSGLQNRLQRFESARDLPNKALVIVCCKSFFILRIKITKFVGLEIKKAQIMGKALLFIAILSSFNLFAQMPASYGTSGATNNINAEVISRFLFGSGNIAAPFSWSPVIPSGGTDITNPNSTGNNILPCRGYSDYSLGNNNPSDGNPNNAQHVAIVERGQMYSMQIVGQRCSGSGGEYPSILKEG